MWHREQLVAFDTESSGVDTENDRIVTATVIPIIPGSKPEPIQWLINPGDDFEIPEAATKVHGITTAHAREHGRPPAEALAEIAAELAAQLSHGVPVVVMNAAYDLTLLDRDCRRHGVTTLSQWLDREPAPVIDPGVLDKKVDRRRKGKRTLTALCQHYQVRLDGAHDATEDALAAARVAWRIAEMHPHIARMPLEQLHRDQKAWRFEQCRSLEQWFRTRAPADRRDPDKVIPRDWPMIPWTEPAEVVA